MNLLTMKSGKIMHKRWDADASNVQTRRVGELDKH